MYINGRKLEVRRYSSGELKFIKSELDDYVVNNTVNVLYVGNYDIFELLLVLKYYKKKDVCINLVLDYLPYQRMDHEDRDELDTVNFVANMFNELELNSIVVCEPHCEVKKFNNSKVISYVKLLKDKVFDEINFDVNKDTVVLTDKGGLKRYGYIAKNAVYFNKERDLETGLIVKHNIVGDVKGKVVIVDDIISTGDTIVNIIDKLCEFGVKEIYVLSGHIENNKYNRRILNYSNVLKVYSTNSLKKRGNSKMKLFDVKDIVSSELIEK